MNDLLKISVFFAAMLLIVSQAGARVEGLSISHKLHIEDAKISCTDCHTLIRDGDDLVGSHKANKQFCAECHDVKDESNCGYCHDSDTPGDSGNHSQRARSLFYSSDTTPGFSHMDHSSKRFDCAICHPGVAQLQTLDDFPLPDTDACGECHMREKIKSSNHTFDWEHTHGPQAELNSQSCYQCHEELLDCNTCHEGDNLHTALSPHPLTYLYSHGPDARMESRRCEGCHQDKIYCTECHASFDVKPLSHDQGGWLAGFHGDEARRDMGQCILCHQEAEASVLCGSCHN